MSNFSTGEFCRIDSPVPIIALQRRFAKTVAQAKTSRNKRMQGGRVSFRVPCSVCLRGRTMNDPEMLFKLLTDGRLARSDGALPRIRTLVERTNARPSF